MALDQDRYLWRHNNVVKYISDNIDRSKYTMHSDVNRKVNPNGGIVPASLSVTGLKLDLTVLDVNKKSTTFTVDMLTRLANMHTSSLTSTHTNQQ